MEIGTIPFVTIGAKDGNIVVSMIGSKNPSLALITAHYLGTRGFDEPLGVDDMDLEVDFTKRGGEAIIPTLLNFFKRYGLKIAKYQILNDNQTLYLVF